MLAFKNNENKANYNNHFLGNFKSSNPMSTTITSENEVLFDCFTRTEATS